MSEHDAIPDPTLVDDFDMICENIVTFNRELPNYNELIKRLSSFRTFCVLDPNSDNPVFGPVKFVGYQGMNTHLYLIYVEENKIGGNESQPHLIRNLNMIVHKDGVWYDQLKPKLNDWLRQYDKAPNKLACFLLSKEDNDVLPDDNDEKKRPDIVHYSTISAPNDKTKNKKYPINEPDNIIFSGPPGTGKTRELQKIQDCFVDNKEQRFVFVTFHQSYSYEDFVEGIRPKIANNSQIDYDFKPGALKKLCDTASRNPTKSYAILIDEINRGNVSNIFGETITLIEKDKRIETDSSGKRSSNKGMEVELPYSGKPFGIPKNVNLYGTMNTADRSIAFFDLALRRRFTFEYFQPLPKVLQIKSKFEEVKLHELLLALNTRIEYLLDREHTIGHSYFLNVSSFRDLQKVFSKKIIPLLQEMFYNDWDSIRYVLADVHVPSEYQLICKNSNTNRQLTRVIPDTHEEQERNYRKPNAKNTTGYVVKHDDKITKEAICKIYLTDWDYPNKESN